MKEDLFNVKDRVVVVTGGLGQLGRQFSLALLERGARVDGKFPEVTCF